MINMTKIKELIKETKKYLTKYDYEKVIELCDKILEIDPESTFGLRFKAIAHFQSGNYEKGLEYYHTLYQLRPDYNTKYSIAYLNEKLGNYEKALEFYDNSESVRKQRKRKILLTKLKRFSTIIEEYDDKLKTIENDNSTDSTRRRMVYLEEKAAFQYRNGQYDEALESLKMSLKLYKDIEGHLYKYIKESVENWYGLLEDCVNKYPDATDFFRELFDYDTYNIVWSDKFNAGFSSYEDSFVYPALLLESNPDNTDLLSWCSYKYEDVDIDYSIDCCKRILDLEAEDEDAIIKLLELYSRQYSKDKSLELINQKLHIENQHLKLLYRKIKLLESMTLYDEALTCYEEYLSINNDDTPNYNELTVFDKMRCMEAKALECYLENRVEESYNVLREVSEMFNHAKNSGKYNSWQLDMSDWYDYVLTESVKQSNNNPAIFFEKFLTVTDRTVNPWISKIRSLNTTRKLGNPITYCDILLEKNKNNVQLLSTKANIYYSRKRFDEALRTYNRVLKLEDNNDAKNYKFNILMKHHQYKKAYQLLESMNVEYPIVNNNLYTLAEKLLEKRRYEESLYVYETIFEKIHNIDTINRIKYLLNKLGNDKKLRDCPYYMDWIDLINYKYESDRCPTCKKELTPILYGYPAPETMERADKGEIILGGCCVSFDSPTHFCKHCKKHVHMETYGIDVTNDDIDLASYTRRHIHWISGYIKEHPDNTIAKMEREALTMGLDHDELVRFIEKLEEIGHIKREDNSLKLVEDDWQQVEDE